MDDIVKQAMAKWPNVPHCYGWLALDARGGWRMRDERAQAGNLPGDKIAHRTLLSFINRNYMHDDQERWYFQNGPQRVYVDLEVAPYVARTDPVLGFVLHTNEPLNSIDAVWLMETGQMLLQGSGKIALVDDRDMAQCMAALRMDGAEVSDERLLAWLADRSEASGNLTFDALNSGLPVRRIDRNTIAEHFHFVQRPRPDAA